MSRRGRLPGWAGFDVELDARYRAGAQPGATATAQRPSRAIRSKPGAARVDHDFSTVTRGGDESTRPVLGSKLNTREVNCTPCAGGRCCWIVAWIARFLSPVRYRTIGIGAWVGTVTGRQRSSAVA